MTIKLVCLRLWFPHVYGWYLIFRNNYPVCCISPEMFSSLKAFVAYPSSIEKKITEFKIILGQHYVGDVELIEVDPSKSSILEDKVASDFIPAFYRYFEEVFQEGSPFIDSDMDFLSVIQRYFPTDHSVISLDVGAGSGRYAKAIRHSVSNIVACDIATQRLKGLAYESDIQVVGCDVQNLPFKCSFGFVMCNFVLEHVANPYRVLYEIVRVLSRHGTFLISFPSFCYRDIYASKMLNETPFLNFEHLRSFSAEVGVHPWEEETHKLIKYLEENSCEIIEVRGTNITFGLDESIYNFLIPFLDIPEIGSTNQHPWNLYGQQTIIFGRKK